MNSDAEQKVRPSTCAARSSRVGDMSLYQLQPSSSTSTVACMSSLSPSDEGLVLDPGGQKYLAGDRLLQTREVCELLGHGKTKLYEMLNSDSPHCITFPRPRRVRGTNRNLWFHSEIVMWIATHLVTVHAADLATEQDRNKTE